MLTIAKNTRNFLYLSHNTYQMPGGLATTEYPAV